MLYYTCRGDPAGTPILFIHAGSFSGRMWNDIADRLPQFHCIIPDLPGHDRSADHQLVSLEDAADKVAELIRSECDGVAIPIVGLSFGSYVGMTLMIRHPELVSRAVLSGFQLGSIPNPKIMIAIMNLISPLTAIGWTRRKMVRSMGVDEVSLASREDGSANATPATMRKVGRLASVFDVEDQLAGIDIPTLVIAGGREHPVILRSLANFQSEMPHCTARIVPGLGHGWCAENPDLFAETVQDWVTGQALPQVLEKVDNIG